MERKSNAPSMSPRKRLEEELQGSSKNRQNRTNMETPKFSKRKSMFEDQGSSSKRQNRSMMKTPKFGNPSPLRPSQLPNFFDNDEDIDYDGKVPSPVKTPEELSKVCHPELPPPPPIQRDKRTKENIEPEHEQPPHKKFKKGMFLG